MTRLRSLLLPVGVVIASAFAQPAQAAFPIYPTPGTENPAVYSVTAGSTNVLSAFFVGNGGASFTVNLGVYVNGVDRGLAGYTNQSGTFGQIHNFGAINAGDTIEYYITVQDTGLTYRVDKALNADGVQHFYRDTYSGTDFGYLVSGGYYGAEDLPDGGDFNYTDFQWVSSTSFSAVPEPATWALMILGFGMVGASMRIRRAEGQALLA